jgi:hypothetical protein
MNARMLSLCSQWILPLDRFNSTEPGFDPFGFLHAYDRHCLDMFTCHSGSANQLLDSLGNIVDTGG